MDIKTAKKEEKKVEYLELIYDLIFVYVIGRNNSLLHQVTDGFVGGQVFIAYILCTLTVIQIWNFSTYYINMHGRNGLRDHVCLFINMFLLYFMGEGTRAHWDSHLLEYHIAWGLILVNLGMQYFLETRNRKSEPEVCAQTGRMGVVLMIEALIVFATYPIYTATGVSVAPLAILFGVAGTMLHGRKAKVILVDFTHLTERAMLYVVFTFGEMIIVLADYFEGGLSANTLYFALMSFLIVVGLFLSYGTVYDHLIDREMKSSGLVYMLIHIFLIFALSIITTSLEFMHNSEIRLFPKIIMLIASFLTYYVSLFLTLRFSKAKCRPKAGFVLSLAGTGVSFVALMLIFMRNNYVNIALSAVYVWGIFLLLHHFSKKTADHA
ncbi:MAG: low temperature requirement protein A [Ruminococcus sp.]|nr:low temperature requirement protein A [Ruminococcus sp.]